MIDNTAKVIDIHTMIEKDIKLEVPNILKEDITVIEIVMTNMLKMSIDKVIMAINIENDTVHMMIRIQKNPEVKVENIQ